MPRVKLKPWKFPPGEKVILYWICSPYRQPNGNWIVKAVFLIPGSSDFEIAEYPWGTLPALTVGWYYVDGLPDKPIPKAMSRRLFIPRMSEGKIVDAFDISSRLYDFKRKKQLGKEQVWKWGCNNIV